MNLRRGVSRSLNYGSLFQDWEIAVAKKLIKQFQRQWTCLSNEEEFDDFLQECLTHWLFSRDSYDPSREASKKTFMGRVIQNKLTDIVREREADKRKAAYHTVSIGEPLHDNKKPRTVLDKIDADRASAAPYDPPEAQLTIDLSKAWAKLSPRQRRLCQLLKEGYTLQETSKILKTPRTTLYDEKERIKALFSKENLREYLD